MIKVLERVQMVLWYWEYGEKKEGKNPRIIGDCSGLRGDCSGLRGDCSGISGNCSGLSGNLDEAKISDKEREEGIDIKVLIK